VAEGVKVFGVQGTGEKKWGSRARVRVFGGEQRGVG